jgi:hypothetical protein
MKELNCIMLQMLLNPQLTIAELTVKFHLQIIRFVSTFAAAFYYEIKIVKKFREHLLYILA